MRTHSPDGAEFSAPTILTHDDSKDGAESERWRPPSPLLRHGATPAPALSEQHMQSVIESAGTNRRRPRVTVIRRDVRMSSEICVLLKLRRAHCLGDRVAHSNLRGWIIHACPQFVLPIGLGLC